MGGAGGVEKARSLEAAFGWKFWAENTSCHVLDGRLKSSSDVVVRSFMILTGCLVLSSTQIKQFWKFWQNWSIFLSFNSCFEDESDGLVGTAKLSGSQFSIFTEKSSSTVPVRQNLTSSTVLLSTSSNLSAHSVAYLGVPTTFHNFAILRIVQNHQTPDFHLPNQRNPASHPAPVPMSQLFFKGIKTDRKAVRLFFYWRDKLDVNAETNDKNAVEQHTKNPDECAQEPSRADLNRRKIIFESLAACIFGILWKFPRSLVLICDSLRFFYCFMFGKMFFLLVCLCLLYSQRRFFFRGERKVRPQAAACQWHFNGRKKILKWWERERTKFRT